MARDDWASTKREERARFLDALDIELRFARFGGPRGDPFANQKSIISEGFVNRTLPRDQSERQKRKTRKGRARHEREKSNRGREKRREEKRRERREETRREERDRI